MWQQNRTTDTGVQYTGGLCLQASQRGYKSAHWYPRAIDQWTAEPFKHYDRPPLGIDVPIYFSIPGIAAGHIANRLSDGRVASASKSGVHNGLYIHKDIDDLVAFYKSGGVQLNYLGWGEMSADVRVVEPKKEPKIEFVPMETPRVLMTLMDIHKLSADTKQYDSEITLRKGDYRMFVDKAVVNDLLIVRTQMDARLGNRKGFRYDRFLEIPTDAQVKEKTERFK